MLEAHNFCIHQIPAEYADDSKEPREDSFVKFVFYSDDVEADRSSLLQYGVLIKNTSTWKDIALCDGFAPEGNVFQISSRV